METNITITRELANNIIFVHSKKDSWFDSRMSHLFIKWECGICENDEDTINIISLLDNTRIEYLLLEFH